MNECTLVQALGNVNGTNFVGLDTITKPVLLGGKANTHQGRVQKLMEGASVMVFQNRHSNGYANMVERRLEAEGKDPASFVLSERKWGERVPDMPIVRHTKNGEEKIYLEVIFLKAGTVTWLLDGKEVDRSEIQGLKDTPEEGEQGGLDNKVIIRTFAAESIMRVRVDNEIYF